MKTILAIEREPTVQCLIQADDSKNPISLIDTIKYSPGLLENYYSIQVDPFLSENEVKPSLIETSNVNRIQNLIEDNNYLEATDILLYYCSVGQFPSPKQIFNIIEFFIHIIQSKVHTKNMIQALSAECIHKFCDLLKCLEAYHSLKFFIKVYEPLVPNNTANVPNTLNIERDIWKWIECLATPKDHELLGTLSIILLNHFSRIFSEDISLNKFKLSECFLLSLIAEDETGKAKTQIRKIVQSLLSGITGDYSIPYLDSPNMLTDYGSDSESSKKSVPSSSHSADTSEDEMDVDQIDHSKKFFYDEFWMGMEGSLSIFQQIIHLANSELVCTETLLNETCAVFQQINHQNTKNWFLQAIPSPVFKVQLIDLILSDQYLAAIQAQQMVFIDHERILNEYLAPDFSKMMEAPSRAMEVDDSELQSSGLSLGQLEQYPWLIHQLLLNFAQYTTEYTRSQAYPEFFDMLNQVDSKLVTLDNQIKIIGRLSLDWPKKPVANIGKFIKYSMIGFPYPGKRRNQF